MQVERIDDARGLALCAAEDGSKSTVEIALVEPVGARRPRCSCTPAWRSRS